MQNPVISFILPVYNGESCLFGAASSVLSEQEIAFELLIVDDGSQDGTAALCDALAQEDARVRVFHTQNQGQGKARNLGLRHAQGAYIMFVDADDAVLWQGIRSMLSRAEQGGYDVVCGLYCRKTQERVELIMGGLPSGEVRKAGTGEQTRLYHCIKTASLFGYLWNKLYRKSFLTAHDLWLDDIRKVYMEDTLFNLKLWSWQPSYYLLSQPVYVYDASGASTTRRLEPEIAEKNAEMIEQLFLYYKRNGCLEENLDVLEPLAMRVFCWSLVKNAPMEGLRFKELKRKIRVFLGNVAISKLLAQKGAGKGLAQLPSFLQRCFYKLCFYLLKARRAGLLSAMFWLLYPVMKIYILRTVK